MVYGGQPVGTIFFILKTALKKTFADEPVTRTHSRTSNFLPSISAGLSTYFCTTTPESSHGRTSESRVTSRQPRPWLPLDGLRIHNARRPSIEWRWCRPGTRPAVPPKTRPKRFCARALSDAHEGDSPLPSVRTAHCTLPSSAASTKARSVASSASPTASRGAKREALPPIDASQSSNTSQALPSTAATPGSDGSVLRGSPCTGPSSTKVRSTAMARVSTNSSRKSSRSDCERERS